MQSLIKLLWKLAEWEFRRSTGDSTGHFVALIVPDRYRVALTPQESPDDNSRDPLSGFPLIQAKRKLDRLAEERRRRAESWVYSYKENQSHETD